MKNGKEYLLFAVIADKTLDLLKESPDKPLLIDANSRETLDDFNKACERCRELNSETIKSNGCSAYSVVTLFVDGHYYDNFQTLKKKRQREVAT